MCYHQKLHFVILSYHTHKTFVLKVKTSKNAASQTKGPVLTEVCRYTPNQHQQHKWAALVWRGWLTSSMIIGQMPIPALRNETHPVQRANYQSQPLCSQQEMTSGVHVICSTCQRKSALHQIKCKHQLKSRMGESSKWNLIRAAKQPFNKCEVLPDWDH